MFFIFFCGFLLIKTIQVWNVNVWFLSFKSNIYTIINTKLYNLLLLNQLIKLKLKLKLTCTLFSFKLEHLSQFSAYINDKSFANAKIQKMNYIQIAFWWKRQNVELINAQQNMGQLEWIEGCWEERMKVENSC